MTQEMQQQEGYTTDIAKDMNASPTGQHLLLGEFVVPIGQEDPTGETRGVTDGTLKCWVADGQLQVAIYSREVGAWTRLGEAIEATVSDVDARVDELEEVLSPEDGSLTVAEITVTDVLVEGTLTHTGTSLAVYGGAGGPQFFVAGALSTDMETIMSLLLQGLDAQGFLVNLTTA